ncbi:MAG: four helix bundle suffix domain-containing protein [Lentisphaeria bacterium]|nr:four helix bundle suffix domain-containing protein [Lentisphaeria bacterium]
MDDNYKLLLPNSGYRKLKSFQLAQLMYDITVHFVNLYIPCNSRTCDQMIQAARSGVQNIAEGSVDGATSTKIELKLYNIAQGSLEELRLDYQDYLRQHGEKLWEKESVLYKEFVARRVCKASQFKEFIAWAEKHTSNSVQIRNYPYKSVLAANAVLLLIDTAIYFLKRQIQSKVSYFLQNGGFSERMYNYRYNKKV